MALLKEHVVGVKENCITGDERDGEVGGSQSRKASYVSCKILGFYLVGRGEALYSDQLSVLEE